MIDVFSNAKPCHTGCGSIVGRRSFSRIPTSSTYPVGFTPGEQPRFELFRELDGGGALRSALDRYARVASRGICSRGRLDRLPQLRVAAGKGDFLIRDRPGQGRGHPVRGAAIRRATEEIRRRVRRARPPGLWRLRPVLGDPQRQPFGRSWVRQGRRCGRPRSARRHATASCFLTLCATSPAGKAGPSFAAARPPEPSPPPPDPTTRTSDAGAMWREGVEPRGTAAERYLNSRALGLDEALASEVTRVGSGLKTSAI